ncbi:SDR family NAD(P)-dependent oxidoreductase [Candidatus Synchoanobacter obligatus]|uniref:SDR family NAD(P)-dependent oxidoreductase n=1 Tax=Candidatus Synchoanobacter obligatus TaxID=2919597 RepID=A0ABT1L6M5_9GAMM|nr:SDR family NAD(P)-dependent oxidoreductase [Candidatus Synchoanobacter obligatus]MCP8352566.1 SDR family NAD(P)-dependent oxidoreductase [Candidatus Synchoanobacter obligatus]
MNADMYQPAVLMTGAMRGIGLAIAAKFAQEGARLAMIVRDDKGEDCQKIQSELSQLGGEVHLIKADIRSKDDIELGVSKAAEVLGGLDICVLNASVVVLTNTEETSIDVYDMMHQVNARSNFLIAKSARQYLQESEIAHICMIAPPMNLDPKWLGAHLAYTSSRYLASMMVVGLSEEFKSSNILVNALWPKTNINSKDACNVIQGTYESQKQCRHPAIMGDACWSLIVRNAMGLTGEFFVDEEVLREDGVEDFNKYVESFEEEVF